MPSPRLPKTAAILALGVLAALAGCAKDASESQPPRYPAGPYGGAPYGGAPYGGAPYGGAPCGAGARCGGPYGQPPPQGPAPAPGAQGGLLGPAVTAFGVLLQQLPNLPAQLPPLPSISDWSKLPWPFPWPAPPPASGGPSSAPTPDGWPGDWVAFEDDVLRKTNERRAMGAVCGGQPMAPAAPLQFHPLLRNSARGHSRDMATRDYFDHTSPEGKGPSNRANEAGYHGTFVGENIAAGQTDPARVVQAWMESPGHCLNIMDPRFHVLGVGYYFDQGDRFGHYWTQNFGG